MTSMRAAAIATMALGLLVIAWPLPWAPAWTYALGGLGGLAVLAAAHWQHSPSRPVSSSRPASSSRPVSPALAVAAAVISCAASSAGVAVLAAEGLFILGYLLLADLPAGLPEPGRWLRGQLPLVLAGLLAGGAVLAAFAVHQASPAWLTAAGLAAAAVAYLIALPSHRPDDPS